MQDTRRGEEYFRAALAAWQDIEKEAPNDPDVIREMAWTRWWLGVSFLRSDRLQEAEPELRRALALREKLLAGSPRALGLLADHAHNKAYLAQAPARGLASWPMPKPWSAKPSPFASV